MYQFNYKGRRFFESPYNVTLAGRDADNNPIDGPLLKDILGMSEVEASCTHAEGLRYPLHRQRHAARTKAETGGFIFNGHPIDSDRDSILRIGNAATTALTSQLTGTPFATTWTCADEYQMSLDAAGVMALQAALSAHGLACHLRSQELKALIDAPDADLDALADVISIGWPGPAQP
jgi:hypothetical protein